MKPTIIFGSILILFGAIHGAKAQDILANTETILAEETVSFADLNVEEPTFLPSSRLYFFKNFTRGVKRFFTFDPIKKVELELRFTDEKIAETKKLVEKEPEKTEAIERAIENYRASQERLQTQFQRLKETSQNPNVDKLLEKFVDRAVKHEKLFAELKEKFEDKKTLEEKFETIKGEIEKSVAEGAKRDDPEKFAKKLEKALTETKGSEFKHVRSLEILDRIHEKAPKELKEKLTEIRSDFTKRLQEDFEAFEEKHKSEAPNLIKKTLEELPGDKARRLVIIEEIREQAGTRVRKALEEAEKIIEKTFEEREELAERATEAIRHAVERIEKLEIKLKEISSPPSSVKHLAENARVHLKEAQAALENKKYGEAFGLARSAEVLARDALRMLEEVEEPEDEDLKEDTKELEERLNGWGKRLESLSDELRPKAKEALEQARFHLHLAITSLEKGATRETKRHYEQAKSFERLLERILRELSRKEAPTAKEPASESSRSNVQKIERRESRCDFIDKNIAELKALLEKGGVGKEDFERKYGILKKELAECRHETPAAAPVAVPQAAEPIIKPSEAEVKELTPSISSDTSQGGTIEPVTLKIEADDNGFYPQNSLTISKGAKVSITFVTRKENVYYGGLDFRSSKFKTAIVKPGESTRVEFTADESFKITSYWPLTDTRKADLQIEIK